MLSLSIITATYNSAATLPDTLKSIAAQDYPAIQHLIIDGCSTDNTLALARSFPGERHIVSEKDKGIYDAMNKGIALATGDIIAILNSDDVYADERVIPDVMQAFAENPAIDMLYGDLVYVKADNLNKVVRRWPSRAYDPTFFERGHVPPHPTLFVRRRVYEAAGGFDIRYRLAADYAFMLRVFKCQGFASLYLPRLMVRMRLGGATNVHWRNIIAGNREIMQAWRNNGLRVPFWLMPRRIIKRLKQFF